jgi:hypothetical protein
MHTIEFGTFLCGHSQVVTYTREPCGFTYWSRAHKREPCGFTYWSSTDYNEWLFTVSGASFQRYHGYRSSFIQWDDNDIHFVLNQHN